MKFRKVFFTTFLYLIVLSVNAQGEYYEGFVVTNDGDTLSGFIKQQESDYNPSEIIFRSSMKGAERTYTVNDITFFSLKGIASFQRFTMAISMDPVELRFVQGYQRSAPVRKAVFLKILQSGKVITLYSYRDSLKVRFYVLHNESDNPQDLVYKIIKEGPHYVEGFAFRDLLSFIGERAGVMTDKIRFQVKKALYQESELLKICSLINGIQQVTLQINRVSTGFTAGGGIKIARLHYYGNTEYAKNAQSDPSAMYWFSVGYDRATNPYVGKLVFRTDLTLSFSEFTTTTYDYRFSSDLDVVHSFHQGTVGIGLYALYNFINRPSFNFFVSGGFRGNYSVYDTKYEMRRSYGGTSNVFDNRDSEPRRLWISLPVKAGVIILKKAELAITYCPKTTFNEGDFIYRYGISSWEVGGIFHF